MEFSEGKQSCVTIKLAALVKEQHFLATSKSKPG